MEVALRAKEVERQTGNFVFTKERTLFPSGLNNHVNQVPIPHLTPQVFLEAGDAGVCHHCLNCRTSLNLKTEGLTSKKEQQDDLSHDGNRTLRVLGEWDICFFYLPSALTRRQQQTLTVFSCSKKDSLYLNAIICAFPH